MKIKVNFHSKNKFNLIKVWNLIKLMRKEKKLIDIFKRPRIVRTSGRKKLQLQ